MPTSQITLPLGLAPGQQTVIEAIREAGESATRAVVEKLVGSWVPGMTYGRYAEVVWTRTAVMARKDGDFYRRQYLKEWRVYSVKEQQKVDHKLRKEGWVLMERPATTEAELRTLLIAGCMRDLGDTREEAERGAQSWFDRQKDTIKKEK